MITNMNWSCRLILFVHILLQGINAQNARDAREGEDVTLECRFSPEIATPNTPFYWLRTNKRSHDNVAINSSPLDPGYSLDNRTKEGRYDLLISNASYERDNGKFECCIKAPGSGRVLHSQSFIVTVLTVPGPTVISPSSTPIATEGKPFELTCSSTGGSPEPVIRWFREGQGEVTDSITRSTNQNGVTSAVLNLQPSRTDDGAIFRCIVWNRAMPEGMKHETKITLGVNYYPRVEIGPENPVRVEKEGSVTLQCNVDAKPRVNSVRWSRNDRFVGIQFTHTINHVTMQDAGKYTCTADNGLGHVGEAELMLEVQYPPHVTIEGLPNARQREAEDGESVSIQCNVSANPPPIMIEWLREGKPEFRQPGDVLLIHRVNADSAGAYTCRAVNVLNPTSFGKQRTNRVGNASVTLLVRHRPGLARITPEKLIAMEGTGITLTCSATPPGWPIPKYKWWREIGGLSTSVELNSMPSASSKYTIPSVQLSDEGKYMCQASNELGEGETAIVKLTVYQAPKFINKLQPHVTRKDGDADFSVVCSTEGKPKPMVRWLKEGKEVSAKLFENEFFESEGVNGIQTIQSTLKFEGRDRPGGNQMVPGDSGLYSCIFENDVKRVESTMNLRVEHGPIVLHKYNKVAYDFHESAEVVCKVQAYPRPEFQWSFSTNGAALMSGSDGHYEINTTVNESGGDIFTSVLRISNIREADYGEYHCRVLNTVGNLRTTITLQPKGPPEKPEMLNALFVGHNYVVLQWTAGFDGGVQNTKYSIAYRPVVKNADNDVDNDCYVPRKNTAVESWLDFDCHRNNPCNVTSLDQHQAYVFKVKAYNNKGFSNYSEEVTSITRVDRIPAPQRVTFDPDSHILSIYIGATCLQLVGKVEILVSHISESSWQKVETLMLSPSGSAETRREATILSLIGHRQNSQRSLDDDFAPPASSDELVVEKVDDVRVRVRLCLMADNDVCGDYTEAEVGSSYMREASAFPTPTLIAMIVSCMVFVLLVGLILVFCRCKKAYVKKCNTKDYDMENSTVHPSIVQQPPPPYYSTTGLENKALEHSMDLVMDDTSKTGLYGGHAYAPYASQQHPNGVNMGYIENSYSNSNNEGSVNSQDSLWQMKMASAASNANSVSNDHAPRITDQVNHYGMYDPLTHGGYRTMDDYAHYPHLTSASPDYSNHTPSHQDYSSVLDKRNRMDPRLESPYHDVNGLPNPYMDHQLMDGEESIKQQPGQHLSISFDESLESGFSTPNSRSRRIIREIIV